MVETPTPYQALLEALAILVTQTELARVCGVSPTAVWKWLQSSKRLPAEYVLRVEAATGVSRHWLRPDIYPVDHAPAPARFFGVDRRDATHANGLDRRINGVSLKNAAKTKGASL